MGFYFSLLILFIVFVFTGWILRRTTRSWRRKIRYRRRVKSAEKFWEGVKVLQKKTDNLYIVATFTTAPDRIHLLEPVLQSLTIGQTRPPDEIHLNIPHRFARTGAEYIIPSFLENYPVKIFRCEDEGPGTKIIPSIRRTPAEDDKWFFIVDDDIRHLPEALSTLVEFIEKNFSAAYGYADNYLYKKWTPGKPVDFLCGFAGFIVHRSFFKEDFESYLEIALREKNCRFHDDIYLSNYLALHDIPRFRIATETVNLNRMEKLGCLLEQGATDTSLALGSGSGLNTEDRAHKAMKYLHSCGLDGINREK